jgi:hypothetical protein
VAADRDKLAGWQGRSPPALIGLYFAWNKRMDDAAICNVVGLVMNLAGVILLFLYVMLFGRQGGRRWHV